MTVRFSSGSADEAARRRPHPSKPGSTPPVTGKFSKGESSTGALQLAREHVATFAAPDNARSAWVLTVTLLLWFGTMFLGKWWWSGHHDMQRSTWSGLLLSACWVLARAGAHARTFIVMHDTGHGAFFSKRWMNWWAHKVTGVLVATDAADAARTHAQHHAVNGIEEETSRDTIAMVLWTTKEWAAWPRGLSKAAARVMSDPLILYTVMGPVYVFVLNSAWPHRVAHHSLRQRALYCLGKLLFVLFLYAADWYVFGLPRALLLPELLANQIALSFAMFLYCVEHTFEGSYRVPKGEFDRTAAALLGTSYLPLPWWLHWATIGVGFHHLHHLNTRVACYKFQECHDSAPPGLWEAVGVRKLTARDCLRCLVLSLWNPDKRCYVPFPEWAWLDSLLAGPDVHTQ